MKNFITKNELRDKLRVTLPTINRWMKQGKLPYLKIGRRVLFDPQKIEEYLNKNFTGGAN